jgi:hypothetical protein
MRVFSSRSHRSFPVDRLCISLAFYSSHPSCVAGSAFNLVFPILDDSPKFFSSLSTVLFFSHGDWSGQWLSLLVVYRAWENGGSKLRECPDKDPRYCKALCESKTRLSIEHESSCDSRGPSLLARRWTTVASAPGCLPGHLA